MKKIKLIYVTSTRVNKVIEGQVYNLLEYYKSMDVFSDIVLLQPYNDKSQIAKDQEVLKRYSFRVLYLFCRSLSPIKYFVNIKSLRKVLDVEVTENTVIHTRGGITAPLIRKALPPQYKDAYILADFRGLTIPEIKVAHRGRWIDYFLAYTIKVPYAKYLLNLVYRDKHTYITTVSPYFRELVIREGVPTERVNVHPNIVSPDFVFDEDQRQRIREKYSIPPGKIVAVMSSSGGVVWQNDHIVIDRLLELGCVVFNLGKNKIEKEGVINEMLARSEMPKYLSAADVAVLWRENIPLNNVACPSKFAEFAVMGLYTIHNGSVDIATRFINNNNAGFIFKNPADIELNKKELELSTRVARCKAGYELFSVQQIAISYIKHYMNHN